MNYSWKQKKAVEKKYKEKWLELEPSLADESGIYILTRADENGFKYAYVGQSVKVLTRLAEHNMGYQHIDLSLKKHGMGGKYGWKVAWERCSVADLDQKEKDWVRYVADLGFQLRNATTGSQSSTKSALDNGTARKGYYDGKKQGYEDCRKRVCEYFEKYLDFTIKGKPNKIKERKFEEFEDFVSVCKGHDAEE